MRRVPNWLCHGAMPSACLLLLLMGTGLTGCSSVSHVIADSWPRALGGLPDGVPPRPETPPAYMPVHEPPPPRDSSRMTAEERAKFAAELAGRQRENTSQAEEVRSQSPGPPPARQ